MTYKSKLASAISLAILGTAMVHAVPAFAADNDVAVTAADSDQSKDTTSETKKTADKVEKIEVTGSRIKRVDLQTVSPVTVITAEDMKMSGVTTVEDALNNVTANTYGNAKASSGYSEGGAATTTVDLRGLGATLVLLDGHRLPSTGGTGGTQQDISMIPMAIVQRIEILRDGASAIYGSDAVAGVINIITKKNISGVNFSYSLSSPKTSGGLQKKYTLSAGVTNDKGSIVFVAQHTDQNETTDAAVSGTNNGLSSYSSVPNAYGDDSGTNYYDSSLCDDAANTVDTGSACKYAYSNTTWLYPQYTKDSVLTNATYDLTDDLTFKGQVFAGKSLSWSRYAPTPVSQNGLTVDSDNENNPYGEDITVYLRGIKARDSKYVGNNMSYLGSLEGSLDVGNGIDWTTSYQHSTENEVEHDYNLINDSVIQDAIDDGSFDILNSSGMSYDDWSAEEESVLDEAYHTGIWEADQTYDTFTATGSTELYSGGGYDINAVVGAEYEHLNFWQQSDPESANMEISGGAGGDDVDAKRDRQSYYTEVVFDLPHRVEIDGALRYDGYNVNGDVEDTGDVSSSFHGTSPKIGIMWHVTDNLLLRADWGKAFRAPSMKQMFASSSVSWDEGYDYTYCSSHTDADYCTADYQFQTYYESNQNLKPEKATSYTVGFVWNLTDNLSAQATYWNYDYKDKIDDLDVDTILAEEYANGSSSRVERNDDGTIAAIYTSYVNLNEYTTDGVDAGIDYLLPTQIGDFKFKFEGTWVNSLKEAADSGDDAVEYAGETFYPDLKANLSTQWSLGDYGAALTFNYIGRQVDHLYDYYNTLNPYVNTNLTATYNTSWNAKVSLGVANVFDVQPKYDESDTWRGYDYDLYDVNGRTLQLSYSQSF
ncbi:TonB-dependent receptor [Gallaecimonas mangrovi]|uniref:TonB-dependent receptor n=1 Tax=Gallaecimonas mangrovi TaxID=2291597 RepID=UPI000E202699|nr:TonB-dependent receptor [Gallaecimonas mangrovi]